MTFKDPFHLKPFYDSVKQGAISTLETWEKQLWNIQTSPASRWEEGKRTGRKPQTWSTTVMEAQEAFINSTLYPRVPLSLQKNTTRKADFLLLLATSTLFLVQDKTSDEECSRRHWSPAYPRTPRKWLSLGACLPMFSKDSVIIFLLLRGKLRQKAQN